MRYVGRVSGLLANPRVPPPNLFTPDFGQEPHLAVGRDALDRSLRAGLGGGPRDHRFTSLLLGPRGSGKTVMLNAMRDAARESGWLVLPLDASTDGIHDRIGEYIEWAQETYEALPDVTGSGREERSSTRFRMLPFEWQREVVKEVRPRWGLRRKLTALAAHAAQHDSAVLLIVDELHSGERAELRRMAADLQHITKNEQLPLAFMGAGLSEMKHTLLEDRRMTFFQRCNREDMPLLTKVDAERFLAKTVHDAGGAFEGEALEMIASAAGTLPFRMQLVGHYSWLLADAPLRPIGERSAASAVEATNQTMHDQVALPTWHSLNGTEQAFMRSLAELGGTAAPPSIAERVAVDPSTLSRAERHLDNAGCIAVHSDGTVGFAGVITAGDMGLIAAQAARYESTTAAPSRPSRASRRRPRCNAAMPRAHARCVLPVGHAGGHRSR